MGSIILTGISNGKHQFSLTYPEIDGVTICMAHCKCGYEVEIIGPSYEKDAAEALGDAIR